MMWTSANPTGGGSFGAFSKAVSGGASGESPSVVVVALAGAASTGAAELDVFSTGGVDEASVGIYEATTLTGGVEVGEDSVDVAATWARTGLTMANPTTSAMTSALAPANVTMFVFIQLDY